MKSGISHTAADGTQVAAAARPPLRGHHGKEGPRHVGQCADLSLISTQGTGHSCLYSAFLPANVWLVAPTHCEGEDPPQHRPPSLGPVRFGTQRDAGHRRQREGDGWQPDEARDDHQRAASLHVG